MEKSYSFPYQPQKLENSLICAFKVTILYLFVGNLHGGRTSLLETSRVSEQAAEKGIVACLATSPLFRERLAEAFNAATLLDAAETAAFVKVSQPKGWAKFSK